MEEAARRYARRILILHGLLLILVLVIILFMLREVYHSTRQQVLQQAQDRQELLAQQLATGVSSFYDSISDDLQLLNRMGAEDEQDLTPPPIPRATIDRLQRMPQTGIVLPFMKLLWNQLHERVSMIMVVDRSQPMVRVDVFPEDQRERALAIVKDQADLITGTKGTIISPFLPNQGQSNLICVAMPRNHVLVAVVPAEQIARHFLADINDKQSIKANLLDATGCVMATSESRLIGYNIAKDAPDPRIAELAGQYLAHPKLVTTNFEKPSQIGDLQFPPRMVTLKPLTIAHQTFSVLVSSDLADVEASVNTLLRRAFWWAAFVTISVTGILISTAIQMIRGRVRMEHERAELIQRELKQAREIQLAWLPANVPQDAPICMAAINRPASHISGDFYDWFTLPGGRTVVTIGDVTGHGLSATFLMAVTQLLIRNTMVRVDTPGACLEEVNRQLCMQAFSGQFVTILVMVIDPANRQILASTAGHFPPLFNLGKGYVPMQMEPQLVLAVESTTLYPTERFELQDQMDILLYTDGVVDAQSSTGHRLTIRRICSSLNNTPQGATPQKVVDHLVSMVDTFRGSRELEDDLTAVSIRLDLGKQAPHSPADAAVGI